MLYPAQLKVVALRRPLATILRGDQNPSRILSRAASLSAIHRGIRQTERVQYGGPRPSGDSADRRNDSSGMRPRPRELTGRERRVAPRSGARSEGRTGSRGSFSREPEDVFASKFNTRSGAAPRRGSFAGRSPRDELGPKFTKAMDGASGWRQQQKLRKKLAKKKEEEEAEDEDYRKTRRKRFTDSESDFGKNSLVYRLKYGDLKDTAANLEVQDFVRPVSFRDAKRDATRKALIHANSPFDQESKGPERRGDRDEDRQPDRRNDRSDDRRPGRRGNRDDDRRPERRHDRSDDRRPERRSDRDDDRRPERRSDRDGGFRGASFREPGRFERRNDNDRGFHDRSTSTRPGQSERRSEGDREHDDEWAPARGRKKEMMPMTLKYTTAASQFLYGRNVVKAALEQARRKLYNLYIYGGENRMDNKDNTTMTRLARKHGVPVTIVPNHEQRIMDKMSMGRPHNGFVLEASPLPQLPIRSLGRLEETPTRLGFHVELGFQTREDEAINGTNTFVKRANDFMPKPFVLLLNEIIDPGNLGAILRTASYLGIDAVGITTRGSSTLTPIVLKSAAGAVEEISLFTVEDPLTFIEESGRAGWKSFAAVAPPDRKLVRKHGNKFMSTDAIEAKSPLNEHPCLLIMGNEGHGLPRDLKVAADYELSIPRFVQGLCVDSLNVSVATGILCHSFVKDVEVGGKSEAEIKDKVEEKVVKKSVEKDVTDQTRQIIDMVAKLGLNGKAEEAAGVEEHETSPEETRETTKAEKDHTVEKKMEETTRAETEETTHVEKEETTHVEKEETTQEEKKPKVEKPGKDTDLGF
ncbi:hypothetical protein AK830_g10118 [Neonectria ditissima]|uniref:rRNA methyltransferase 1, mitochondrial n=1 Tax=Neonectria ditissima TaxID=78410 RepID=A0A0P7B7F9_9HYPO|nr:hypothetical protein AK830_g10118 [Neonectria ditissima]